VISATNKDLRQEIRENRFREDLYHRLSVIPIQVPSLNDRKEDIPVLVEHFLSLICREQGIRPKPIQDKAIMAMQEVDWTGNIRELRNVLERLVILCDEEISKEDVVRYANPK
jgi:DNA-binding NtrC family response regulator